jgi:hypothetical protein
MADPITFDTTMSNNMYNSNALIIVDVADIPVEIQDGIVEMTRHYPYKNFATADSMGDADYSSKWIVR